MHDFIARLRQDPKTTVFGLFKIAGAIWYLFTHPESLTELNLLHPETLLPLGVLASGVESLFSADAKDEIKASEVRSDTTLIGEK
jgi:hypothetical protein